MTENEYVEVTVIEPMARTSTLNSTLVSPTKTLSTIEECNNTRYISRSDIQRNINDDILNSAKYTTSLNREISSNNRMDFFQELNNPLDIDLLLRLYACNSSMEKSIKRVIEEARKNRISYSKDSLDCQAKKDVNNHNTLRIELGALYKIYSFLIARNPSENSCNLSGLNFRRALILLQCLLNQCNRKQLTDHLANDPTIKICKHCGVISCSQFLEFSTPRPSSPPRNSYFLNVQRFPKTYDDNSMRLPSERRRNSTREGKEHEKSTNRRFTEKNGKESNRTSKKDSQRCNVRQTYRDNVERVLWEAKIAHKAGSKDDINNEGETMSMIAERETCGKTQETHESHVSGINTTFGTSNTKIDRTEERRKVRLHNDSITDEQITSTKNTTNVKDQKYNTLSKTNINETQNIDGPFKVKLHTNFISDGKTSTKNMENFKKYSNSSKTNNDTRNIDGDRKERLSTDLTVDEEARNRKSSGEFKDKEYGNVENTKIFDDNVRGIANVTNIIDTFESSISEDVKDNIYHVAYCNENDKNYNIANFLTIGKNGTKTCNLSNENDHRIKVTESNTGDTNAFMKDRSQYESLVPTDDVNSTVGTMKRLAHDCLTSIDEKEQFVSQLNERTDVENNQTNKTHTFVSHTTKNIDAQLQSGFWLYDKSTQKETKGNFSRIRRIFQDYYDTYPSYEYCKYSDLGKSYERSESLACSYANDSLENCNDVPSILVEPGESDTTTLSSSSAENMIREWIKSSCTEKNNSTNHQTTRANYSGDTVRFIKPRIVNMIEKKHVNCTLHERSQYLITDDNSSIEWHSGNQGNHVSENQETQNHFITKQSLSSDLNVKSSSHFKEELKNGMKITRKLCTKSFENPKLSNEQRQQHRFYIKANSYENGMKHLFDKERNTNALVSQKHDSYDICNKLDPAMFSDNRNHDLSCDQSENFIDRINYDEISLRSSASHNNYIIATEILAVYRKIFESHKQTDWKSFQRLVHKLHPTKKQLWNDICKAISDEAERVAERTGGSTEVCVEISPVFYEEKKGVEQKARNEIVFEMDVTFEDVERFLPTKLFSVEQKEQLDTHKNNVHKITNVQIDDVRNTKTFYHSLE